MIDKQKEKCTCAKMLCKNITDLTFLAGDLHQHRFCSGRDIGGSLLYNAPGTENLFNFSLQSLLVSALPFESCDPGLLSVVVSSWFNIFPNMDDLSC